MLNSSRQTKIIAVFLALIAVGAITAWYYRKNSVPQDFTQAREQGALIAQNIVNLSDQSTNELTQVNNLDKSGDYTNALVLTTQIITQNQTLHDQAISLSVQVGAMTKSLPEISSANAQQAALDSISSRLALVSELVDYSDDLQKLLVVLQNHFTGATTEPGDVQAMVDQINTDVNAINNFNVQAQQSMSDFDTLESRS